MPFTASIPKSSSLPILMQSLPARRSKRSYAAAGHTNLLGDWNLTPTTPDREILQAMWIVRERARDLIRNNDYAKKASLLFRVNIVGPTGFKFQSNVKEPVTQPDGTVKMKLDRMANLKIEEGMKEWSRRNHCSMDGRFTFRGIQDQAAQGWFRDGEAFVRFVRDKKSKFGCRLQLIEPEAIAETLNTVLLNGNIIKMGVELDTWRRPVAYYIRKRRAENEVFGSVNFSADYEIVPAADVIHLFDQEFANQTRGISILVSSMVTLKMLGEFEAAALAKCRIAAADLAFIIPPEGGGQQLTGDGQDEEGNTEIQVKPGSMPELPPGYTVSTWGHDYPNPVYEPFVKTHLHRVSAGVGVAYSSLTNDLGDTSYSSARVGLLEERELWRLRQQIFIDNFLDPMFPLWLEMAITSNQVALPMWKFDKFNCPVWVGRRWAWVDPLKDVMAKMLEVQAGFNTATQVIAEMGNDIDEVYQELAEEKASAAELGLTLKLDEIPATSSKAAGQAVEDPPSDGKTDPKAKRTMLVLDPEEKEAFDMFERALIILAGKRKNGHHQKEPVA